MNRYEKWKRVDTAANECLEVMRLMKNAEFTLSAVMFQYGDLLSEDRKNEISEIRKELGRQIHETNIAANEIFQKQDDLLSVYAKKTEYESIMIPKDILRYENDQKVLIELPEGCKYSGYSFWMSKKFVTDDPSGDSLQVRYYPDWMFRIYRYERSPKGKYVPSDRKEISASELEGNLMFLENRYQSIDEYTL